MFRIFENTPGLLQLQKYFEVRYAIKVGDGGGKELTSGSFVLAKYSGDELYYRARIHEVMKRDCDPRDRMYSISYLDYGNSEVVCGAELMSWNTRMEEMPEYAMACCLEGAPQQWGEPGSEVWTMEQ